ncbi:MAG: RNA polymerase sigma factor, partial [bacterium]|nr:RNA polymerase sigma factor [bacterium]
KNKPRPELQEYIQKKRALDDTVINKLDLQQAIEKLNSDDQKLVVMHYSEDYSYKELAEKLDMAESTVKSRLFEARKKLRCYLNR